MVKSEDFILDHIRDLIARNKFKEAIEVLKTEQIANHHKDSLIVLLSNFDRVSQQERNGTIRPEDLEIRKNKLNAAILATIRDIEDTQKESENVLNSTVSGDQYDETSEKQRNKFWIYGLLLIAILSSVVFYMIFHQNGKKTSTCQTVVNSHKELKKELGELYETSLTLSPRYAVSAQLKSLEEEINILYDNYRENSDCVLLQEGVEYGYDEIDKINSFCNQCLLINN